jgi:hypothetical protein
LRKTLYGLKQDQRAWNERIDNFLIKLGFIICTSEHKVYVKGSSSDDLIILCLYADDLLIARSNKDILKKFKSNIVREFEMSDVGDLSYFLGFPVWNYMYRVFWLFS